MASSVGMAWLGELHLDFRTILVCILMVRETELLLRTFVMGNGGKRQHVVHGSVFSHECVLSPSITTLEETGQVWSTLWANSPGVWIVLSPFLACSLPSLSILLSFFPPAFWWRTQTTAREDGRSVERALKLATASSATKTMKPVTQNFCGVNRKMEDGNGGPGHPSSSLSRRPSQMIRVRMSTLERVRATGSTCREIVIYSPMER